MSRLLSPTVIALAGLVLLLTAVIVVREQGDSRATRDRVAASVELVESQRAGCERSKLDRADNAAGWTAHSHYISNVTRAASVKEDVKRAARRAVRTYRLVAQRLDKRSRINCAAVFPMPPGTE